MREEITEVEMTRIGSNGARGEKARLDLCVTTETEAEEAKRELQLMSALVVAHQIHNAPLTTAYRSAACPAGLPVNIPESNLIHTQA